jgi:hypothetical protein
VALRSYRTTVIALPLAHMTWTKEHGGVDIEVGLIGNANKAPSWSAT